VRLEDQEDHVLLARAGDAFLDAEVVASASSAVGGLRLSSFRSMTMPLRGPSRVS